jgi:DNA polymerase-3 subunit gamma/tau
MGKALYRKYRSKSLDEIVGQEHITDTLRNALKKGAISHAYLFTGPRGTGKTSIARILAHAINDIDYSEESTHLDIIEIDAASNRRIDEIRELRDKVHIVPTSAKYKVYIIDEVHMLTREAFNALLKTLEEPPEHAVFMLATTEAHKIPDTIMSRTQRFTLKPIPEDKAAAHLRTIADSEGIKLTDEAVMLLAQHGRGSFRDSISMLDQLSGLAKESYDVEDVQLLLGVPTNDVINAVVTAVAQNNQSDLFQSVRELKEQGIDVDRTAKALSHTLRESIITNQLVLEQQKTLQLLKNLLDLTGSSGDFLGLELALLDVMEQTLSPPTYVLNESIERPEPKLAPAKPVKTVVAATSEAVIVVKPEIASKPSDEIPTQKSAEVAAPELPEIEAKPYDKIVWQEMLNALKVDNNTLYGVLRMVNPEQTDEGLLLTCRFGFHKKQLESPKNKPIISTFLKKYTGDNGFSVVVDKSTSKPVEKPAEKHVDNKPNELIDNVSNIFGSAELLES